VWEGLSEYRWLYRGVPEKSPEKFDVEANNEVYPQRPDRTGEWWRELHQTGDTETAYTSWSTDRDIAQAAGEASRDEAGLEGGVIIFKVRITRRLRHRIFQGREDEEEYLIEGTVEAVQFSNDANEEEQDE
jgi:hypothetical protein